MNVRRRRGEEEETQKNKKTNRGARGEGRHTSHGEM